MSAELTVLFAHANGFPAPVYRAFRDACGFDSWMAIERLGFSRHGVGRNWEGIIAELVEAAERLPKPVLGLGHSLGGFCLQIAACRNPGLFDTLILMEPPMFIPRKRAMISLLRACGVLDHFPPVSLAKKRRRQWRDMDEARSYFQSRELFAQMDAACLEDFLSYGLELQQDASLILRYPAEKEYEVFVNGPPRVGRLPKGQAAWFLYGRDTDTLNKADLLHVRRRNPGMRIIPCHGSHLFPLQHPIQSAQVIRGLLQTTGV